MEKVEKKTSISKEFVEDIGVKQEEQKQESGELKVFDTNTKFTSESDDVIDDDYFEKLKNITTKQRIRRGSQSYTKTSSNSFRHALQTKSLNIFVSKKPWIEKPHKFYILIIEYLLSLDQGHVIILQKDQMETLDTENFDEEVLTKMKCFEDLKQTNEVDLIVTIGGDGNLLWISKLYQRSKVPLIVSFACGTRNFLCYHPVEQFKPVLIELFENINKVQDLQVDRRKRLHCILKTSKGLQNFHAFNDIVIEREKSGIAYLDIYLNDQFFLKLLADGIIISTSSGSTAYSLSAGGSILHPKVTGTILTPICSIETQIKPVVVPEFIAITVKQSKDARSTINFNLDGHTIIPMESEDTVKIVLSPYPMQFYMANNINPLTHWVSKLSKIYHYTPNY